MVLYVIAKYIALARRLLCYALRVGGQGIPYFPWGPERPNMSKTTNIPYIDTPKVFQRWKLTFQTSI